MSSERFDDGLEVRKAVLGADHVARSQTGASAFTADFQTYITETVWHDIWTRPGLDRKARSMITIAMLAALGRSEELRLHIRATPNTGVSREEVREILLQCAAYAGVPAANSAFAQAAGVFAEMDKAP